MSSYVIVDVGELADLLVEIWYANSRQQRGGRSEADAEELRRETERLDALEEQARQAEIRLDEQYEASLEAISARYGTDAASQQARQLERCEHRRRELQALARNVAAEAEALGSSFLADFTNYHAEPALYREIAQQKQSIQQSAERIIQDSGLLTEFDAENRFAALEEAARQLERSYSGLTELFARHAALRGESEEKQERISHLLKQLASGARSALERVQILPQHLPGAAAEAQAVRYALDTIRHYLLEPESTFLDGGQREELRRLYGIRTDEPLEEIAGRSGGELKQLNNQFRGAKKRSFDRTIFEGRTALENAMERYVSMYEAVHGSLDGIQDVAAAGTEPEQLEVLRTEISALERRYQQTLRQRLLEDTLERALTRSRKGMQVRRVAAADTAAGNRKTLYQIGSDGMAMEVYTDARGQVLIEAGGVVQQSGPATPAQKETIERNNAYFCEHELPAILSSFAEELRAANIHSKVLLQREPEEDRLHVFALDAYEDAAGALVIQEDGAIRRHQAPASEQQLALEEE